MAKSLQSLLPSVDKSGGGGQYWCSGDKFCDWWPNIWRILAQRKNGKAERAPGSLMLFVHDGTVTVRLTEENINQVTYFTDCTPNVALDGLEAALEKGRADWRVLDKGKRKRRS